MTSTPAAQAADLRATAKMVGGGAAREFTKRAEAIELTPLSRADLLKMADDRAETERNLAEPRLGATLREQIRDLRGAAERVDQIPTPLDSLAWRQEAARHLSAIAATTEPDRKAASRRRANIATEAADKLLPGTVAAIRDTASRLRRAAVDLPDPVGRNELATQAAALESHADKLAAEAMAAKAATVTPKPAADPDLVKAIRAGIDEALGSFRATRADHADLGARLDRIEKALAGGGAPVRRFPQRR